MDSLWEKIEKYSANRAQVILAECNLKNELSALRETKSELLSHLTNIERSLTVSETPNKDGLSTEEPFVNIETGIIDCLPCSFKTYLLENDMPKKIMALKKGLDENSLAVVNQTILKILHLPELKYNKYFYMKKSEFDKVFGDERNVYDEIMTAEMYAYFAEKYKMSELSYDVEVLHYHHNIKNSSQKLKDYIKGKDFIDGGAYMGDSALVFNEYHPRKIYSFEISPKMTVKYNETMRLNGISEERYETVPKGLSSKKTVFEFSDIANAGTSQFITTHEDVIQCEFIPLDDFVEENTLNVGLIKADIEGSMYDALQGMVKTIEKDRPVMSFSIYHSPIEFFETKPLLGTIVKDLNYKIEIRNDVSFAGNIFGVSIFAQPLELVQD